MDGVNMTKIFYSLLLAICFISLVGCSLLQGPAGEKGDKGDTGSQGEPGKDGRSIVSITLANSKDNVDTYVILFDDNTTTAFTVTNGKDGQQGIQGIQGESGKDGAKGDSGRGISKIEMIKGIIVVTYTDGTVEKVENQIIFDEHELFTIEMCTNGTYSITGIKDNTEKIVTIPSNINGIMVTKIASDAFMNNLSLEEVYLANTILEIGDSAFSGCSNLSVFNISKDSELKVISAYAFNGCGSLKHIYIPKYTNFIGNYAFYNSGLETAYFEDYVAWNFKGSIDGYTCLFQPVNTFSAAKMLATECSISGKTYSFYKTNILKDTSFIASSVGYIINVGTRE